MLKKKLNDRQKIKKLFKEHQNYAKKNSFRLNPNKKIAEGLIKSLAEWE